MFKLKNIFVKVKFDAMLSIGIISIGDELLIGQTINTNASWMGELLAKHGYKVKQVLTISDNEHEILHSLKVMTEQHDLVLITGGLGPTKDDITKQVLCDFFETELILNEEVLKHVEQFFSKRNRPMLDVNRMQAMVPKSCKVLFNDEGTAPGMLFQHHDKIVVSMPGVPYEMKFLMQERVLSFLKERFNASELCQQTYLTQGIGESFLAEKLKEWENELRGKGLDLAYLPSPGMVKLRITSAKGRFTDVERFGSKLIEMIPSYLYGKEDEALASIVGELLIHEKQTIGTVESCTGGAVASEITRIPGASAYFCGSLLTYTNTLKVKLAKVDAITLEKHGAVSMETVKEMAIGAKEVLGVDWMIAISGIAGPLGGTEEKPVGLVWVAIAGPDGVFAYNFQFGDNRERNIQMTVLSSLNLLRCRIKRIKIEKKQH